MRKLVFLAALIGASAPAAAETESYTAILGGKAVGRVVADTQGDQVDIEYDVKNNGRGPTFAESLQLDARGLPAQWTITGTTTFGSKVDERFARKDGQASWQDSAGKGEAAAPATLYVGQNASPWALGLCARALLADPD